MCIRDRWKLILGFGLSGIIASYIGAALTFQAQGLPLQRICLLYTSDAADDLLCVDLGGRRIIKKKKQTEAILHQ